MMVNTTEFPKEQLFDELCKITWSGFWKVIAFASLATLVVIPVLSPTYNYLHLWRPLHVVLGLIYGLSAYFIWRYPQLYRYGFSIKTALFIVSFSLAYLALFEGTQVMAFLINFVAALTLYSNRHLIIYLALSSTLYLHWLYAFSNGNIVLDHAVFVASLVMAVMLNLQQRLTLTTQIKTKLTLELTQAELIRINHTDDLTQVSNRRFFMQEAERLMALAERNFAETAFIVLDIDHFKDVNDSYGHIVGDAVLVEVAERVTQVIRKEDVFARLGGEEFALMIPFTSDQDVLTVAEKVRHTIASSVFNVAGQRIPVTVSLGVSLGSSEENLVLLLEQADQALYRAKSLGRNQVVKFEEVMHSQDEIMSLPRRKVARG